MAELNETACPVGRAVRPAGRVALAAEILVEVLGVSLPPYTQARLASTELTEIQPAILAQKDPERLERWLEKAVVATSVAAVIDEPN